MRHRQWLDYITDILWHQYLTVHVIHAVIIKFNFNPCVPELSILIIDGIKTLATVRVEATVDLSVTYTCL